jgi:U3 small nucleolar RNA-associated protein 25
MKAILESYERHFGTNPVVLTQSSRETVDRRAWTLSKEKLGKLGSIVVVSPEGADQQLLVNNGRQLPVRRSSVYPMLK